MQSYAYFPPSFRRASLNGGLAVLAVALGAALRIWLGHHLGASLPWITFYPAVMVMSLYGGLAAGLLTTALSCVTVAFLWPLLAVQPLLLVPADYVRMAFFILVGTMISGQSEVMHWAKARAAKLDRALVESERFIRAITDSLPGMVAYWDKGQRCCYANHAYLEWFGRRSEEMIGLTVLELMGEKPYALNEPYIRGVLGGEKQLFERASARADGSIGHTWAQYIPDISAGGTVEGFFVLVNDVTRIKAAEADLRLTASVFRSAIEGIVITDAEQHILSVNPAFTEITGYTAEEAIGLTPRILKSNHHDKAFYAAMWRDLDATGRWQGEIWNRRKGGDVYLEWLTITKILSSSDEPMRYVSVFHDITESRHNDERIRHLAFHDALTDLPNRSLLMDRLDHQIARAERERGTLAVVFLDLDHFKVVNDTLGHDVGDDLLRLVAQKLQAQVRQSDTVARLGGDEFVILLDNPAGQEEVVQIMTRIIADFNEPMVIRGKTAQVGTSLGIAMFPADGPTPDMLIQCADAAMYSAKRAGRNTYRFFQMSDPPVSGT